MVSQKQIAMLRDRSYDTAFEIWDCIKNEIILYVGMIENPYYYFHIDLDEVFKTASNDKKTIVFESENSYNFKTHLLKNSLLSFELNISLNNTKNSSLNINDVVYYYLPDGDFEDDGSIHYVYEGNVNVENIKDFELEFILELSKEIRVAWHKIVNNLDINANSNRNFLCLEEKISKLYVYSQFKNLNLTDTVRLYSENLGINNIDKKKILSLIEKGYLI